MKTIHLIIISALFSCSSPVQEQKNYTLSSEVQDWKSEVQETLKLFGHRNWIVIADAAYPQQSSPAIKTITVDASQLETVKFVNQLIEKAGHVDANIFIDRELAYVHEHDAVGIDVYRKKLNELMEGKSVKIMLHEDIIRELDTSSELFNVLIIKTDLTIPYTSVFYQLECGYWSEEAEQSLRKEIKTK